MNILLGVCGSISCYRTYDLVREYLSQGHQVKVILTQGAQKFIKKDLFIYLGAEAFTDDDDFSPRTTGEILHIALARWCDRMILAPLSANTLAHLAHGEAKGLLTSTFLALGNKPLVCYPAMNTQMLENPLVKRNMKILEDHTSCFFHESATGVLACGEVGQGKLPPLEEIFETSFLYNFPGLNPKNIIITMGATLAPLDPIRFLTNPSSGKTGIEFAKSFLKKGHRVFALCGPEAYARCEFLDKFPFFNRVLTKTTRQMKEEALRLIQEKSIDVYVATAANCDIEFQFSNGKIKKSDLDGALSIKNAPDILNEVLQHSKKPPLVIGMAAETSLEKKNFVEKLKRKPVSLLIGNVVEGNSPHHNEQMKGLRQNEGEYFWIEHGRIPSTPECISKKDLAHKLVYWCENKWSNNDSLEQIL